MSYLSPDDFLELMVNEASQHGPPLQLIGDEELKAAVPDTVDVATFTQLENSKYYQEMVSMLVPSTCRYSDLFAPAVRDHR